VRDIEWYVYNNASWSVNALGRIATGSSGYLGTVVADAPVPGTSTAIQTIRVVVPSSTWGPYPLGTSLVVGLNDMATDGSVTIAGARVGFSNGAGTTGLIASARRIYDSRTTGGILTAGTTRKIVVPPGYAAKGTVGIHATLTSTGSTAPGTLKTWPVGAAEPPDAWAVAWAAGQTISNSLPIGISAAREFYVKASANTHLLVDALGTIS
jgi:hypothetical protein